MKKKGKLACTLLASFFAVTALFSVAACASEKSEDNSEFVFKGSGKFGDGNDYHITLVGNKDDEKSFLLTVDEIPMLELGGTWVMVENKGYKLYLDDTDGTYVYTRYNPATKEFSAKFNLNLSGGLGRSKVALTYRDEEFAKEYDGKGLPMHPPTFTGYGWAGLWSKTKYDCSLICREDGTCVSITDKTGVPNRNGVYTYDEETNVFSFEFEDEVYQSNYLNSNAYTGFDLAYIHCYGSAMNDDGVTGWVEYYDATKEMPKFNTCTWHYDKETGEKVVIDFKTTYDEATKTYSLIYEAFAKGFVDRLVTYTVED